MKYFLLKKPHSLKQIINSTWPLFTSFKNSFVHCIDKFDIMKKLLLLLLLVPMVSCLSDDDKGVIPPEPIKEPNAIVVCYEIYLPVCGSDGITYSNDCKARVAGITEFTTGECSN